MKTNYRIARALILLIVLVFSTNDLLSQNNTCANASPFCTGQTMNFPATTGVPNSQPGPNYGCLGSQPNPAWFFMQINQAGPIDISMSANNDIDFIAYGPFTNLNGACNNLTAGNTVDCSYSASNTETCNIVNAVPGAFYVILITNFANTQQNITFNQSNTSNPNAGNTNCGLVCVISATNSGRICPNQPATIQLNSAGTSTSVSSFSWAGPGGFNSTSSVNIVPSLTTTTTFTLFGSSSSTINGVPTTATCQALTTVTVVPLPVFTLTPAQPTICQGQTFLASASFSLGTNTNSFTFNWAPHPGAGVFSPYAPTTSITPLLLPPTVTLSSVIYTIAVSPTVMPSCSTVKSLTVTINNPLTPTLTMPSIPLCNTFAQLSLTASPGGGTWTPVSPAVTAALNPGGAFTPSLVLTSFGTQTVLYSVAVGTCIVNNTGTLSVSRFNSPAFTSSLNLVCVQDPTVNLMNLVQNTNGSWLNTVTLTANNQAYTPISNNIFTPAFLGTGTYLATYNTTSTPVPNACAASSVLSIPLFNPPTPTISVITPTCTNAGTVTLTANPPGGVWSGNPGVSVSGIQTPSLNPPGTNFVSYAAGIGTCIASSSTTFHVSQFRTAILSGTINPLCYNSSPVNLKSIVQSTTGTWGGISVNNNIFSTAGLPTNIYLLTYTNKSTPDSTLCPDVSSIFVSVLNPATGTIVPTGPYCSKDGTVQLSVIPPTGAWTAFSYVTPSGVFTPSLAPIGNNFVEYVIGTSTCNTRQTSVISVEAFVPADITSSKLPDLCNTGLPVNLSPFTLNSAGTWSGTAITGSNFDPSASGAGYFVLSHHTKSYPSGLCPHQATIAVQVFSLAPPVISNAGPFCDRSNPQQLIVSPIGGLFQGANTGAVSQSGLFNPAHGIIGKNVISYSISSGPCIAFTQNTVTIEKFVSAALMDQASTSYCKNNLPFNLNSLVMNPGGLWSGAAVVNGSMFDPSKANIGDNNVLVYRTRSSSENPLLCPDMSTIKLKVDDIPAVNIVAIPSGSCAPAQVAFNIPGSNLGKGQWFLGDGNSANELSTSHIYTSPGSYSVVFNYTVGACSTQVQLANPIVVSETPKADFSVSHDEVSISAPEVELINQSTQLGNNRHVWTIPGLEDNYELNPKITFPKIGNYRITLTVTDYKGCSSQASRQVEVKNDFNVFIPNSFTPNQDGINDYFLPVFSPYGLDPKTYEMEIYDRWGHLLFASKDATKGWDGTIGNKGEQSIKQETYVYKLRFKDLEGKVYYKTGYFTVL